MTLHQPLVQVRKVLTARCTFTFKKKENEMHVADLLSRGDGYR